MAQGKSTTGNTPENYGLISKLIALEEKRSNEEYRRVEARGEALQAFIKGFFALLSIAIVGVWLYELSPPFLVTVGHLFSTDLSFREYMEFKPHVDPDGYIEFHERLTNWEIVMLWFFILFIICIGYKLWMANGRRETKHLKEKSSRRSRIWDELDTWNKKALLDLAKEKELSPPLNMRSTKYEIINELLKRISRW